MLLGVVSDRFTLSFPVQGQLPTKPDFVRTKAIGYYQSILYLGKDPMGNNFNRLTDTEGLDELADRSKQRPIVIFKHSLTCPISAAAYDQMTRFDGEVVLIEVQRARQLSNEIENRLGVAHESPQVIVMRKGKVVWNASHFKITADAVAEAVRNAGGAALEPTQ